MFQYLVTDVSSRWFQSGDVISVLTSVTN